MAEGPVNKGALVAFVVLFAIAAALIGFLVYFFVNRAAKKKADASGQVLVQRAAPATSSRFGLKQFVTGNQDNSVWTYSAVVKLGKFQSEENNVILLSRGDSSKDILSQSMIVILDNNSSSMYVAFRNLTPFDPTAQLGTFFSPFTFQSLSDTMANAGYINKYFCVYKVSDIPYFRYFSMHILWDYNNGLAKVYIDGNIVTVCNLLECADAGLDTHRGDTVCIGYKLPGAGESPASQSVMSLTAWGGAEFRYLKVMNSMLGLDAIKSDASDYVASVYEQIRAEAKNLDTCTA